VQKKEFWNRFAVYVLPLLIWMGVIFIASTPSGSADNTRPIVNSILRQFFPDIIRYMTAEQIDQMDWIIRKGAHVTEYAILALLAYRAFRLGRPGYQYSYPAWTLIIGTLYAASDEYHQSFFPSRGASVIDVLIDMLGVAVGIALSLWGHCGELQKQIEKQQEPP
jgi:VanZ family protein